MRKSLLDQILSEKNLHSAYQRVYQNQGMAGVDKMKVSALKGYLVKNQEKIKNQIRQRQFKPQPVLRVEIPKDNGDVRLLGIPTVVDRFLQQAIYQVISPIFEKQFHSHSFGYRPNKSCEMAVMKSLEILNNGYCWVVDFDLERFFDLINHDKLMAVVSRTIKEEAVNTLIKNFLTSGVMINGKFHHTARGVSQGSSLSPLLSNIMLGELDQKLVVKRLKFVRYADDTLIFTKTSRTAKRVMKSVSRYITGQLGLVVNMDKSHVSPPEEVKFLGFSYVKFKSWQAIPHPESVKKLQGKIKDLTNQNLRLALNVRNDKLKQSIQGWVVYFRMADMKDMLVAVDGELKFRMRVVIWKGWVAQNRQIISLVKLGIEPKEAERLAWSWKGDYFIGNSRVLQRALSDERLKEMGVPSVVDCYLRYR